MTTKVKPIPDGYHTVTPYLIVSDGLKAIEFYKQAFGATETVCMTGPGGNVMHAEIRIGDSMVMLASECPQMGTRGPLSLGGTPVTIALYVEDADAVTARATAAGAKVIKPIQDQFYGDRSALVTDPFGHSWNIATHKEDVSAEEIKKRAAALFKQ